ncbi:hypothetical protein AMATHDRAFT_61335 [Amanita thiersii Skay4041]|uniref:Uncharacterized protein n=1 Tax=Amanita thiersii Skay4041 TaxID=703135 RepID=A0A2A9NPW5_9AGAR|nr:hypothetical protein AMATHDRAFT_61335 [Amanita thiersii Skay4041]
MSSTAFFYEPFYDFDRLFNGALNVHFPEQHRGDNSAPRLLKPRMDIHEDTENNTVTATVELPGLSKEDINIDVHNGRLTVSGENKSSTEHQESGYVVRERKYGRFSRTLQLPQGIKDEEIKAKMEHGVLVITFPKNAPELAPKKIEIA